MLNNTRGQLRADCAGHHQLWDLPRRCPVLTALLHEPGCVLHEYEPVGPGPHEHDGLQCSHSPSAFVVSFYRVFFVGGLQSNPQRGSSFFFPCILRSAILATRIQLLLTTRSASKILLPSLLVPPFTLLTSLVHAMIPWTALLLWFLDFSFLFSFSGFGWLHGHLSLEWWACNKGCSSSSSMWFPLQNEHDIELIKKAIIESITDSLRYKFQNTVDKLNGMQRKKSMMMWRHLTDLVNQIRMLKAEKISDISDNRPKKKALT